MSSKIAGLLFEQMPGLPIEEQIEKATRRYKTREGTPATHISINLEAVSVGSVFCGLRVANSICPNGLFIVGKRFM